MNILLLHGGYWPYPAATNRAATDLAEGLQALGHAMQVVSMGPSRRNAPCDPKGRRRRRLGVRIHRVADCGIGGFGRWNLVLNLVKYHLAASRWLWRARQGAFDIVMTLDSPLGLRTLAWLARLLPGGHRYRHVAWFMDLTAESRRELRAEEATTPLQPLRGFYDFVTARAVRNADLCVVLGRCMAKRLARTGIALQRIAILPMWNLGGDPPALAAASRKTPLLDEFGWGDRCVVMYAGHAGTHHDFGAIRSAVYELRDDARIAFLLFGDAPPLVEMEAWAHAQGLSNLRRRDFVPLAELGRVLAAATLHLVTLRAGLEGTCVPSKFYGSLAAGRPVLFVGSPESEVAREIIEADAGRVIAPGDGAALARAILELAGDPVQTARLGENARRVYAARYRREIGVARWDAILRALPGRVAL